MERLATPQTILIRGIVAYHALLESGHGWQGGRSRLRLLVRLDCCVPVTPDGLCTLLDPKKPGEGHQADH